MEKIYLRTEDLEEISQTDNEQICQFIEMVSKSDGHNKYGPHEISVGCALEICKAVDVPPNTLDLLNNLLIDNKVQIYFGQTDSSFSGPEKECTADVSYGKLCTGIINALEDKTIHIIKKLLENKDDKPYTDLHEDKFLREKDFPITQMKLKSIKTPEQIINFFKSTIPLVCTVYDFRSGFFRFEPKKFNFPGALILYVDARLKYRHNCKGVILQEKKLYLLT
ncbi:Uncharacterized protein dnl_36030 [Desulfonema limicola]|uniref:Uncharacterized protein n=1 Tax=Desulfonema limicola TaxID=45656 RepID=A0A975B9R6_9BACT|nr:hypothetical protein [Desulfonema limicola]QTA81272.1 Uncharacterized protein dnl_36030 [Desulfonema limicola]